MAGWPVRRRTAASDPHLVTSAPLSREQDRRVRQRRYFVLQGFRVLCIAVQAFPLPGWARIVLIVAAVCLPWMGVVQANAGPSQVVSRRPAATAAPEEPVVRTALAAPRVIDGDTVPGQPPAPPSDQPVPPRPAGQEI